MAKRLRILAGPNGSGKSSLKDVANLNWGIFVNADEIEKQLRENLYLDLTTYGIGDLNWEEFLCRYESLAEEKHVNCEKDNLLYRNHTIVVIDGKKVDSYLACVVAEYIRFKLLDSKGDVTFTIETVMSHESKLNFMREARNKGFRIYLYYVSTSSPEINVGRVAARVQKGGHNVLTEKIYSRYFASLRQLREAILLSDRAYIFDNSKSSHKWVAEYDGANGQMIYKSDDIPFWVVNYVHQPALTYEP